MINTALSNAKSYDFQTWLLGIFRSFVSGGSSAIVSGFTVIGIDPQKFNFSSGTGQTIKVMAVMFLFTGIYRMCEFLTLHSAPEAIVTQTTDITVHTEVKPNEQA